MQFFLLLQFDDVYSEKYFISNNEAIYAVGWWNGVSENTKELPIHIIYQKRILPGIYCEKTIFKIDSIKHKYGYDEDQENVSDIRYPKINLEEYYQKIKDIDVGICGEKIPYELEYSRVEGFDFSSNPTCTK